MQDIVFSNTTQLKATRAWGPLVAGRSPPEDGTFSGEAHKSPPRLLIVRGVLFCLGQIIDQPSQFLPPVRLDRQEGGC